MGGVRPPPRGAPDTQDADGDRQGATAKFHGDPQYRVTEPAEPAPDEESTEEDSIDDRSHVWVLWTDSYTVAGTPPQQRSDGSAEDRTDSANSTGWLPADIAPRDPVAGRHTGRSGLLKRRRHELLVRFVSEGGDRRSIECLKMGVQRLRLGGGLEEASSVR